MQLVSTQCQSTGLFLLSPTTSSSPSSLDFESDEYFDADSEMLLDRGVAENVVPSVNVPWENHPDVEEDDHFHDMDDNTSMGYQTTSGDKLLHYQTLNCVLVAVLSYVHVLPVCRLLTLPLPQVQ